MDYGRVSPMPWTKEISGRIVSCFIFTACHCLLYVVICEPSSDPWFIKPVMHNNTNYMDNLDGVYIDLALNSEEPVSPSIIRLDCWQPVWLRHTTLLVYIRDGKPRFLHLWHFHVIDRQRSLLSRNGDKQVWSWIFQLDWIGWKRSENDRCR